MWGTSHEVQIWCLAVDEGCEARGMRGDEGASRGRADAPTLRTLDPSKVAVNSSRVMGRGVMLCLLESRASPCIVWNSFT